MALNITAHRLTIHLANGGSLTFDNQYNFESVNIKDFTAQNVNRIVRALKFHGELNSDTCHEDIWQFTDKNGKTYSGNWTFEDLLKLAPPTMAEAKADLKRIEGMLNKRMIARGM